MATDPKPPPRAHWEAAYQGKPSDRHSWYQADPARSLAMIEHAALDVAEPLIDVGGGASVLVDRLLERGHTDITVLDISSTALAASQQRLGPAASRVAWVCADVRDFWPRRPFALWHDRALFHFLTDPGDRAAYLATLRRSLRPRGHLVLAAFAVGGPRRCSGLDIVQYDAARLARELGTEFELLEQSRERHRTPAGGEQLFAWFRFQRA